MTRKDKIIAMREAGATWRQIGGAMGVSPARARQIYLKKEKIPHWSGLSTRTVNVIANMIGLGENWTKDQLVQIPDDVIASTPNCGASTFAEIAAFKAAR